MERARGVCDKLGLVFGHVKRKNKKCTLLSTPVWLKKNEEKHSADLFCAFPCVSLNVLASRIRPKRVGVKEILDKNQRISLPTEKKFLVVFSSVHCFSVLRAAERPFVSIENQEGACFLLPSLSQLCWRLLNWIGCEERA